MTLSVLTQRNILKSVRFTTAAGVTLITKEEAKIYLKVKSTTEDDLIDLMLKAVDRTIEKKTHRALMSRKVETVWAAAALPLRVFNPPVVSLDTLTTIYEGTDTVEASAVTDLTYLYNKNGLRPELRFKSTGSFTESSIELVKIVTNSGYGDAATDVPEDLIQAAYLILSGFYDLRENFVSGQIMEIPFDADRLMSHYTVPSG